MGEGNMMWMSSWWLKCITSTVYFISITITVLIYNGIIREIITSGISGSPVCFPATRQFHLGVIGVRHMQSGLLMSCLLHNFSWLLLLQKTLLHKERMSKTEPGFPVLLWKLQNALQWFKFRLFEDLKLPQTYFWCGSHSESQTLDPLLARQSWYA